jgi:hypothetical protein
MTRASKIAIISLLLFIIVEAVRFMAADSSHSFASLFIDEWYHTLSTTFKAFCIIGVLLWISEPRLSMPRAFFKNEINYLHRCSGKTFKRFPVDRQLMKKISKSKDFSTKEQYIRSLMVSIMEQMELPQHSLELSIRRAKPDLYIDGPQNTGQYQHYANRASKIELELHGDFNAWNIAAILAHECAHHWIVINNLHNCDPTTLEYRTDITTIFTGFKRVMRIGYAEKERGAFGLQVYRIGYLNQSDLDVVISLAKQQGLKALFVKRSK